MLKMVVMWPLLGKKKKIKMFKKPPPWTTIDNFHPVLSLSFLNKVIEEEVVLDETG